MKKISFVIMVSVLSTTFLFAQSKKERMNVSQYSYLALGDSYTIGEGVVSEKNYPHQLQKELTTMGLSFSLPKVIAKTGWTTDELKAGVEAAQINGQTFDLVTLLIGVNNQYRGRSVDNYREEFEGLLKDALAFANGKKERVIVLSIPDWGITPFAIEKGVNQEKVAKEIDAYNAVKLEVCQKYSINYIDITSPYRTYGAVTEMLVEDKLHPSEKVYSDWSKRVFEEVKKINW
jgi:lysophospholipase L1-like esterase